MITQRAGVVAAALSATVFAAACAHGADAAATATYAQHAMVVGGGGTPMHGARGWTLDGSVGQPAIARIGATGMQLASGFWQVTGKSDLIFRDGFDPPAPVQPSERPASRR